MPKRLASLIAVLVLFAGAAHGAATATDYVGSWNVTAYGDMNISDSVSNPVVIQPWMTSVNILPSATADHDLDLNVISGANSLSTPLNITCPNCFASLPARNVSWPGSWTDFGDKLVDVRVVTSGNAMAAGIVGQEMTNPSDTAFLYSVWQKNPVAVTRNDFVGKWKGDLSYNDPNIMYTGDGFSPDTGVSEYFKISPGSDPDALLLDMAVFGTNIELKLRVVGDHAILIDPLVSPINTILAVDMVYDGKGLAFATVGQELHDLTDIGLTVGTASPVSVPAPAEVWIFGSGLLGLIGISKTRSGKG